MTELLRKVRSAKNLVHGDRYIKKAAKIKLFRVLDALERDIKALRVPVKEEIIKEVIKEVQIVEVEKEITVNTKCSCLKAIADFLTTIRLKFKKKTNDTNN